MIGTIYIKCNVANPTMTLQPFSTFIGSPSSVRVIDVPKKIGNWKITDVYVTVSYPDNSEQTTSCVLTSGAWVGTVNAPIKTGHIAEGFKITADGIDESGTVVKNYILGKGDVYVLGDTMTTEDGVSYQVHIVEEQPESPNKGDIYYTSDGYKMWNGEAWVAFGGYDFTNDIAKKADAEQISTYFTGIKTVKSGKTTDFDRYYSIDCEYDNGTLKNLSVTIEGQTISQATPISDKQIAIEPFGSIGQRILFTLFDTNEMVTLHTVYNDIDIAENIALVQLDNYGPNQSVKYKTVKESIESHLDGYATLQWVESKNYLSSVPGGYVKRDVDLIVIGNGAELSDSLGQSAANSIAIGKNAKVNATTTDACQIGEGTNNNYLSLQFRSYPLVMFDGHIPFDRISSTLQNAGYEKYSTIQGWVGCEFYNKTLVNAISTALDEQIKQIPPLPAGDIATQEWVESKNYLTAHLSLDAYATKQALGCVEQRVDNVYTAGFLTTASGLTQLYPSLDVPEFSYSGIYKKGDVVWIDSKYNWYECIAEEAYGPLGLDPTLWKKRVPSLSDAYSVDNTPLVDLIQKVADTGIPMGETIATEEWVESKNYLTAHLSLDNYYTKSLTSSAVQIQTAVSNAGKVKTVNGNLPDENGNIYIPVNGALYTLEDVALTEQSDKITCSVNNCTVSRIVVSSSSKPVYITLPTQVAGDVARDFLLRIEITCSEAPLFVFVVRDDESVEYECVEDDWATLVPGINIISFTETKRTDDE